VAFAERVPTAIHFAKFELAFLRDWAERFEPGVAFPIDAVCVHAIACRLYPDLPRRSLRALAGYLGHGVDLARRSLGHVEATAFIWRKLTEELAARGIHEWDVLVDWLVSPAPIRRAKKRRYPLARTTIRALPDEPGVYRMVRSNGDVLYVGKAASVRKRVTSHFTSAFSRTERALEMLTQVHDVEVTLTKTPLEAALLENETIKSLRPPYNVALVPDDSRTWFTSAELDRASNEPDDTHPLGPLPSTFSVRAFGAVRAIIAGESATPALRARAVEVPLRWAPEDDVFRVAFAEFVERHSLAGTSDVRRALDRSAQKLLVAGNFDADPETEAGAPNAWDVERVLRHLERAIAHGHQLLQRARWLCLLQESDVVFREPPCETPRVLFVRGGRIVDARNAREDEIFVDPLARRSRRERQACFDRSHYDRLRTLTTELKRVLRDGGTVAVRVSRSRWLKDRALESLLRWA
jgi:hypothetical protein